MLVGIEQVFHALVRASTHPVNAYFDESPGSAGAFLLGSCSFRTCGGREVSVADVATIGTVGKTLRPVVESFKCPCEIAVQLCYGELVELDVASVNH